MGRHSRRGLFLLGLLLWLGRAVPSAAVEGTCASPTFIPSSGGVFTGTTSGTSALTQNCGTTGSAPESVFVWTPAVSGTAVLTTIHSGFDTVLAVEAQCGVGTTTLAGGCGNDGASCCGDCNGGAGLWDSTVTVAVTAGVPLYVIVDGDGSCSASTCTDRNQGPYRLVVTPPGVSTTTVPACASTTTTTSTSTTSTSSTSTSTTTTPGATTTTTTLVVPPSYPGNLRVNTISCGSQPTVRLTWSPSTRGSNDIQGYIIIKWNGVTGHMDTDACAASCVGLGTGPNDACCRYCTGGTQSGAACLTGADCPGVGGGTCQGRGQSGVLTLGSYPNMCSGGTCTFTEILGSPGKYYYAIIAYDTANHFSQSPTTCALPYTGGGGQCGPNPLSGCDPFPCFQCSYSGTTPDNGSYCDGHPNDCGNPAHSECAVCVVTTTSTTTTTTSTTAGAATTTTCPTFTGSGGTPQWADKIGGPGVEQVRAVASAPGGDVIAVGYFAGTTNFGGTSLTSVQNPNIFIARYHPDGTLAWVKQYGGIVGTFSNSEANAVAVDTNGAIIVGGDFFGTADFGKGQKVATHWVHCVGGINSNRLCAVPGVNTSDCPSGTCTDGGTTVDMFLAKYDAAGNPIWTRAGNGEMGGPQTDTVYGVATDSNSDVVVSATIAAHGVNMGSGAMSCELTQDAGGKCPALAKYASATGLPVWSPKAFPAAADSYGYGVAVDAANNIFMAAAYIGSSVNFGGPNISSDTNGRAFVVKYTPGGAYTAQAVYGTPYNASPGAGAGYSCNPSCSPIAIDHNGDVVLTGAYNGAITIPTTPSATVLTSTGFNDILLVKAHGADLTPMWAKSFGEAAQNDQGRAVAVDANNNITMTGTYFFTATFDGVSVSAAGSSQEDVFVAKYNSSGTQSWAKGFGGTQVENGLGVAFAACNAPVIGGKFNSPSLPFGSFTLTNGGSDDGFLVEVAP